MTEQEHMKRVLNDIRSKERVARLESQKQKITADTYAEAGDMIEIELTRFPKPSTPANG